MTVNFFATHKYKKVVLPHKKCYAIFSCLFCLEGVSFYRRAVSSFRVDFSLRQYTFFMHFKIRQIKVVIQIECRFSKFMHFQNFFSCYQKMTIFGGEGLVNHIQEYFWLKGIISFSVHHESLCRYRTPHFVVWYLADRISSYNRYVHSDFSCLVFLSKTFTLLPWSIHMIFLPS